MLVNDVTFRTSPGGISNGALGFEISFTGEAGAKDEVGEVLYAINRFDLGRMPAKLAILNGEFTPENGLDILTLVMTLKNVKFTVSALLTEFRYFPWIKDVDHVIAQTSEPRWPGFLIHELWYEINDDNPEAFAFPDMQTLPLLYVKPSEEVTADAVMRFIKSSSYPWKLFSPPTRELFEVVPVGEN